ncbi:uncharacterized protein LOC110225795 [Arabidopsis lyrata subsp. lyrata]|uniref:uncharacterized protein LOC110225795 n=1 Tax=Arabidopsis lyrata subsp. lyrata TaxID=81972 RepID=UPI000A29D126|nr:uncharacterized protein LOC110225795 [Arabidopsis lyrata subsp. lyrata]|eukprot:XP_020871455.1 uncharacterized protein LOC110225795 [Arabidopsis lyrata subsp. lyrata]
MDSNELEPPSSDVVVYHQPSESDPQAEEGEGNPEPDIEPDDEDPLERDQFEIEKACTEFRDEPSIIHDEYPDSDSDEDDEGARERKRDNISRGDGSLYYHQTFFNSIAFKEAVLDHALKTGCNIAQYRYDQDKIAFKCDGDGCIWRIYCSITKKCRKWRVNVFKDVHTCNPNGDCEMLKVPVIARLFLDKIREEPEYFLPKKIEQTIKEKWKITVSRPQCQAARRKALSWIEREYDEQFARLQDYAAEIRESNPESTVAVETVTNDAGQEEFNRFYVCFHAIKKTWIESCRPLIGVDGTFIKGKVKGQLLVALGRDANNRIYPIAWGCVQVENIDNWVWFVEKLKSDLGLMDGDGYIIVSDRQKGLIRAVELELPKAEHRMCVRHIYGNLKKNHGKDKEMKMYVWDLAWSYNESAYEANLTRLYNYNVAVWRDVVKSKPRTWCRAFYKQGNFCEDVENNSTESFNNSIVKARDKPFVPMLETIRRLAMVRIATRAAESHEHKGRCTPYVSKFLAKEFEKASEMTIRRSTNDMYEATRGLDTHRISLTERTCTCPKWQICGIPCEHVYGVLLDKKLEVEDYVCHWFRTPMWKKNYTDGIFPQRGPAYWPSTEHPNVHVPPPPPQPGRKKGMESKKDKKRKKGKYESPTKKAPKQMKRVMHCGVCGAAGHNSRFHRKKSSAQTFEGVSAAVPAIQGTQGSQLESSQGVVMSQG